MTHTINGVIITPKVLEVLKRLQDNDNDNINYYIQFLNEQEEKIFTEGRERGEADPKNDLFHQLEEIRDLKEDLLNLKAYDEKKN